MLEAGIFRNATHQLDGDYPGAVTGYNRFFSLTVAETNSRGLGVEDIVETSPQEARHLRALTFTEATWLELADDGVRYLLLYPTGTPSDAA